MCLHGARVVHRVHNIVKNKSRSSHALDNMRKRENLRNNRDLSEDQKTSIFYTYASFEMIAHVIAYDLAIHKNPGSVAYNVLDDDGQCRIYRPIKILTKNQGIVCFALIPDELTNDNSRMHVLFRGTHDFLSVLRDLESAGPGHQSFFDEREGFLQQLNGHVGNVYQRTGQKVKLSVSGHSLGGADAQNASATIIKAMAHNRDDLHDVPMYEQKFAQKIRHNLVHVAELNIAHLNSVGVTKQIAQECTYDATFLAAVSTPENKISINLHALRVENDRVQKTGQTNILSDIDCRAAKVDVLYVKATDVAADNDYSSEGFLSFLGRMLLQGITKFITQLKDAHCTCHFTDERKNEMHYYRNTSNVGHKVIKKHLTDKSAVENSSITAFFKLAIHSILKKGSGL